MRPSPATGRVDLANPKRSVVYLSLLAVRQYAVRLRRILELVLRALQVVRDVNIQDA